MVNAHTADAMVCISNCDKITPGMLMAAMRLNIPAVFVSGGPMEAGKMVVDGEEKKADLIDAMSTSFPGDAPPMSADLLARQCQACLDHDTFDRLRGIPHPTLIVCGRHDQLTPPKLHRELADEMPNARLVTLGYGAHLVMAESAERLNTTVLQFLSE